MRWSSRKLLRSLRRPADLWPRLPWQARFVRITLSVFLLALPAIVLTRQWLVIKGGALSVALRHDLVLAGEGVLVIVTAAVVATALWWTRRRGLPQPARRGEGCA